MALLQLHITKPDQEIYLDWSPENLSELKLTRYWGKGLAPGNPPLFLYVENSTQDTSWGNVGNRVPLIWDQNSFVNPPGRSIPVCGTHFWSSPLVRVKIQNLDSSPGVFQELLLVFECKPGKVHPVRNSYLLGEVRRS